MGLILDKLKFGEFNDVKENDDSHTGDRRLTSPLTALRFAAEKAFSKDTLIGISEFLGVIVGRREISFAMYDHTAAPNRPSMFVRWARDKGRDLLGLEEVEDTQMGQWLYRVYIPELEPLPAPKSYCDPVLVAYKEMPAEVEGDHIFTEGDVVRVRYSDANNLSEPKIIKLVTSKTEWDIAPNNNTSQNLLRSHSRSATTVVAPPTDTTTSVTEPSTGTTPPIPVINLTAEYIGSPRAVLPGGRNQADPPQPLGREHVYKRPYGFPIQGLTQFTGNRMYLHNTQHPVLGNTQDHLALDQGSPSGTKILAIADGEVIFTKTMSTTAGNYIVIKHPDTINGGFIWTRYLHMRNPTHLATGAKVYRGDPIGFVGDTPGYPHTIGNHLHLDMCKEYRFGRRINVVNPIGYYLKGDVKGKGRFSGKIWVFDDDEVFEAGSP